MGEVLQHSSEALLHCCVPDVDPQLQGTPHLRSCSFPTNEQVNIVASENFSQMLSGLCSRPSQAVLASFRELIYSKFCSLFLLNALHGSSEAAWLWGLPTVEEKAVKSFSFLAGINKRHLQIN